MKELKTKVHSQANINVWVLSGKRLHNREIQIKGLISQLKKKCRYVVGALMPGTVCLMNSNLQYSYDANPFFSWVLVQPFSERDR